MHILTRYTIELRNRHNAGEASAGIDVRHGTIAGMWAEHIVQPLLVNTSEIALATECVGMILKIGKLHRSVYICILLSHVYNSIDTYIN